MYIKSYSDGYLKEQTNCLILRSRNRHIAQEKSNFIAVTIRSFGFNYILR